MRESRRDRRPRSVAARVGQDSGRSAPCVQPNTPGGHQRENVRSARQLSPRRVQFSVAKSVQFSVAIDNNNFPWPEKVSDKARTAVSDAAHSVLDARMAHGGSTLADLYDPTSMPSDLAITHAALDRAVDRCYRPKSFASERERVEHLLRLFEQLVRPLTPAPSLVNGGVCDGAHLTSPSEHDV